MYCLVLRSQNKLMKSFDFTFPFCMPGSTNEWEAIYDLPDLSEAQIRDIIESPGESGVLAPGLPRFSRMQSGLTRLQNCAPVDECFPFAVSDSFYFVEGNLIMHNKVGTQLFVGEASLQHVESMLLPLVRALYTTCGRPWLSFWSQAAYSYTP